MQDLIINETNQRRKFHRIKIPLKVKIHNKIYACRDWSVGDIGLNETPENIDVNKVVPATLILSMNETQVSISCELKCRVIKNKGSGFEFYNSSPRLKRILRHYIDMSVEGRLTHVDDIIALTTSPVVDSPIEEALTYTQYDEKRINNEFRIKSVISLLLTTFIALSILATLFYFTIYRIKTIGTTTGTITHISSTMSGIIRTNHAKEGEYIQEGDPLFTIDTTDIDYEISETKSLLNYLKNSNISKDTLIQRESLTKNSLLTTLKTDMKKNLSELKKIQELFDKRLINKKDLIKIENLYQKSQLTYQNEVQKAHKQNLERLVQKSKESQKNIEIKQQINMLELKLAHLENKKQEYTIYVSEPGKLLDIKYSEGQFIKKGHIVAALERNTTPYISLNLPSKDTMNLQLGTTAKIYSPTLNAYFNGRISAIGKKDSNTSFTDLQSSKTEETLVHVDFDRQDIRFPPNTQVQVWIKNFDLGLQ